MQECLAETSMVTCRLSDAEMKALVVSGYEVKGIIAEGTYGLVYYGEFSPSRAAPPSSGQTFPKDIPVRVALKVMETCDQPRDFVDRYLSRELTIHSRISHPHIIHLHSVLQVGSKVILATRYAERGNLLEHLVKFGKLHEKQARQWFRQLAVALAYLHSVRVAHRDLKCENVLITCNNNLKLCDFGFSRCCLDSKGVRVYSRTHCGSLAYAAPELIMGSVYDPTIADMWSLGVVLYAMLNRSLPFDTDKFTKLLKHQLEGAYRFQTKVQMRISKEAYALVVRLLEPNWLKRPTAESALNSEWVRLQPGAEELTPLEQDALSNLADFNMRNKIKIENTQEKDI